MFFLSEGFTYRNFLIDALTIFLFIVWFWLLIAVVSDLFRRSDISRWAKALWVIGLIIFPYIAIIAYLIFQGRGMVAPDNFRRAVGLGVADEIEKLDRLKQQGTISEAEFTRLRARLVQ